MTKRQCIVCPSEERLRDYVSGRLALGEHAQIEAQVESCPKCGSIVETLDQSMRVTLSTVGDTVPLDDELRELVDRARPLWREKGPRRPGADVEPIPPGTRLGHYEIEEWIGSGGMGRVYRARHLHMERDVAVKVVSPDRVGSSNFAGRFRAEIAAAGRVRHENVVAAYDAGETDGGMYLAMEYVDGRNLEEVVESNGPLDVTEAVDAIAQAARGLKAAHDSGIVHRDVKPSNLLRTEEGCVKVADLGLARAVGEEETSPRLTSTGIVMGTAAFLAPEQAADPRAAGPLADVYGLGCTLYRLLTGRDVYDGTTAMDVVFAHRERPVPSLRSVRADCPKWLDQLLQAMLQKRPEERPTIDEVIEAIETRSIVARHSGASAGRRVAWAIAVLAVLLASSSYAFRVPRAWYGSSPVVATAEPGEPATNGERPSDGPQPTNDVSARTPNGPTPIGPWRERPLAEMLGLVELPAGHFEMGSPDEDALADDWERPRHRVELTEPFAMGAHEVTVGLWGAVTGAAPPNAHAGGFATLDEFWENTPPDMPVAGVVWQDAASFCNELSRRAGLPPFYRIREETVTVLGGRGFRLPTEAEWEYACRAGTSTRWSFGDSPDQLAKHAWFADNARGKARPVGRLQPNAWGLYDMHGNVPEWCWDRYGATFYRRSPPINPSGPGRGITRVHRGGSANDAARTTRSAFRGRLELTYGGFTNPVGFRVVRNLTASSE